MEIGKTFRPKTKKQMRSWFEKNHKSANEIWIVFYSKDSGKKFLPYSDVLDEALCFGWIDSIVKKLEVDSRAQRFTPRKPKSPVSELNKVKMRRLVKEGRMTKAGLATVDSLKEERFRIPPLILKELKKDNEIWKNFRGFPSHYQRLKINWIASAKSRPEEFTRRLNYFLKMTKKSTGQNNNFFKVF